MHNSGNNLQVKCFEEKPEFPKTSLCATMIYLIKKEDIGLVKKCLNDFHPDNWGQFASYLQSKRPLHCLVFDEFWYDIGDLKEYEKVNNLVKEGSIVL